MFSCVQAISRCSVERMAVASSGGFLILAVGTATGSVFVVAVTEMGIQTVVWAGLETDTVKGTVKRCVYILILVLEWQRAHSWRLCW